MPELLNKTLEIQTPTMLAKEMDVVQANATTEKLSQEDEKLKLHAATLVDNIFTVPAKEHREQQRHATAINNLGAKVQRDIQRKSAMLKQPMSKLIDDAEDGGPVAQNLLALQQQTNSINPNRVDFTMGTLTRLLAKIPGVGTPLSRWSARYQSADGIIQDIVKSLQDGQDQLKRDNMILVDDQMAMRDLSLQLQEFVKLGQLMDQRIEQKLAEIGEHDERYRFIQEEILFPLRQRIIDLQQQLAVNQQGVLTTEVIIRNNKELIRGVQRALSVTVTALSVATTLALALQTQKKVLKGVQAVNETTDTLIAQTAQQLKTQGAEIHKTAAAAQLDIEKLKQAFMDVEAALQDINQFRRDALGQMAGSISEMDSLTTQMEVSIKKLEGGTQIQDDLVFDIQS